MDSRMKSDIVKWYAWIGQTEKAPLHESHYYLQLEE